MKTILYNPIFINPQAYYVFPQLYNLDEEDITNSPEWSDPEQEII